jgi:DHA2 family methylenomycin A resistance protein-like MFS transporter
MMRSGRALPLLAVCMGFFVIQLDVTIVNLALPSIQRSLGGSLSGLQWVIDSYTLVFASFMLTAGSVADRIGARRVFLAGMAVFTAASAACAAAPSLIVLVAARIVQGLGAAAVLPCSLALIAHQFPEPKARARALGVWGGIGSLSLVLGSVLSGSLIALGGWRLIFLINLPVCAVTAATVIRTVAESPARPGRGTDWAGLVLGVVALAGLTAAFIESGQSGWLAWRTDGLLAAGVIAAAAFVAAERRQAAPMLPLRLFRSAAFSAGTGVGVLFNFCFYGALICLSLYLQQARHETPLRAGLLILPMTISLCLGALVSGRLTARYGSRRPMLTGLLLALAGAVVLSLVGPATSIGVFLVGSALLAQCSIAMPAMTHVVLGSADSDRAGLASAVLNAARQAGGALGVATMGALLAVGADHGGLTLHAALPLAAAGYLAAVGLALLATRRGPRSAARSGSGSGRPRAADSAADHSPSDSTYRESRVGRPARFRVHLR